jgi:hypothetical protein
MGAWCGGAFDTRRDRLLVWGGGHDDYAGNELYAFDLNTLAWSRLSEPSRDLGYFYDSNNRLEQGLYADGLPRSTHTYSSVEYSPITDQFVFIGMGGVSGKTPPLASLRNDNSGAFDFASGQWVRLRPRPATGQPEDAVIAREGTTGTIWYMAGQDRNLSRYDARTDTYQTFAFERGGYVGLYSVAAIDPGRKLMVTLGRGEIGYWNLNQPAGLQRPATSGATEIEAALAPGFEFDPNSGKFVAWNGGAHVYVLDPATWVWTKTPAAASNTVVPTAPAEHGTYGRFRYSPQKGVFVVVNHIDQDVYIYRLAPPGKRPMPATNLTVR